MSHPYGPPNQPGPHSHPIGQPHPQQGPYPPHRAQKKGRGCLIWAAAVAASLLLFGGCIAAIASGGDDTTTTAVDQSSTPKREQAKREKTAGIGDTVRDGKFSFKVTKVEKGLDHVGEGLTASKAQGQYVLVHLTVKNIGDEAQMFTDSAQKLLDSKGRQFDADSGAAIWLKDSNGFLKNINPGNAVTGFVLFDVPTDFQLAAIELHDSVFSGGVKVALS
ncbi:DUF4352 domain-containing protein [Microtetraspora sp. AC03309]|uniref:DUF4352 domain-containing protein n=1 Tax=Microtetraspora sp. AC03309 TaxID=2779376 RepID=UPI001E4CF128|nr:DUF4352 domain-containing protein [Microtetraspora sp. AC03309]MCC5574440.1 DUF4352 domain-containing protein [Microtetraspora sp. AC03309]